MLHISLVVGFVRLQVVQAGMGHIQATVERNGKSDENIVDNFIAERRSEAAKGQRMPVAQDAAALLSVILQELGTDAVLSAIRSGVPMLAVKDAEGASRLSQEGWTTYQVMVVFRNSLCRFCRSTSAPCWAKR